MTAHVTNDFNHLWNDHIKPKADERYVPRSESMFGRIDIDGMNTVVMKEEGVTDSLRTDIGRYSVDFVRKISNCAATVTPRIESLIPSVGPSQDQKRLLVKLVNTANNPVDAGFSLFVRC